MNGFGKFGAIALAVATAAPLLAPTAAGAQGNVCAKREKLMSELQKSHGETCQSVGLQRNAGVIETFANTETGGWTIIVSLPSGMSCLVAAGEAFQKDAKKVSLIDDAA